MKKQLLKALPAALLLALCLTGCGGETTPQDTTVTTQEETAMETVTEALTTPETETTAETEAETLPAVETEPTTEAVTEPETEPETTASPETEPEPEVEVGIERALTKVQIVAGESASEQYAASELTEYLTRKGVAMAEDCYRISLSIDPTMPDDSYRIVVQRKNGDGTTIVGGNGRGVIYGAYRFLEEFGGVRFFTPDLEVVPEGKLNIVTGVLEYDAVFELRHTNWISGQSADWNLKNGMNCDQLQNNENKLTPEMGGGWSYGAWIHTLGWMTGHGANGQPCLSDPQNLENAIAAVRNILASNPNVNIISVSQNDNNEYCKCEACAAIDEIEGSPSGNIIRFVNAIAADIAEDYPDVVIDTLAYMYSQPAPKITKPLPNVCVRFAPLLSCFVHAYDDPDCPRNLQLAKDIEDWSRICDRIYVWDYTTNFTYFIPTFENLITIRQNMQFFAEHNVKGMFAQGNDQSPSGEFGELRAYLLAKLMMNPYMTEREYYTHMDEFLEAYYGDGWRYVRAYIDMTSGKADVQCRGCYGAPLEALDRNYYLAMEDTMDSWWDKAEEMAGDRLSYVKRSRLQWRYLKLMLHPNEEDARAFLADVTAEGIHWREWRYTSEIGADSNLSLSPDKWIYD